MSMTSSSSSSRTKEQDQEAERHEKIIRGLLKLPPNRRCFNCRSPGPTFVCSPFATFVCLSCSGLHREFSHRVKSVSIATFSAPEVRLLQAGGNQRAREIFFTDCHPMQIPFPDPSNADQIRDFIRAVFVDNKYCRPKSFEKPPRDMQNHNNQTEDQRRPSSYHSYSQSPPYDYQYEERIYGKNPPMLTRKPGSDKGTYQGKLASFLSTSLTQPDQTQDDTFANQTSAPRHSDFSASSPGDPFRLAAGQSPNFQDLHAKANANGALHNKRTASSGSIGSCDTASIKSADSGTFSDATDLFDDPALHKPTTVAAGSPVDLFAHVNSQPSSENFGWATFDSPPIKSIPQTNGFHSSHKVPSINANSAPSTEACSADFNGPKFSADPNSSNAQAWHAFEDTSTSMVSEQAFSGFGKIEMQYLPTNNPQSWFSFETNNGNTKSTEASTVSQEPQPPNNPFTIGDDFEVIPTKDWAQNFNAEGIPNLTNPFDDGAKLLPSTVVLLEGGDLEESISTNPFDITIDTHSEDLSMFMDMGSLQSALPETEVPDAFLEAFSGYPTSLVQGAMTCLASQAPSSPFQNMATPTVVVSASGNPFE